MSDSDGSYEEREPYGDDDGDGDGTITGIWAAQAPEELWTALLFHSGGPESSCRDADALFRRLHGDRTEGALLTALLMLTDRRWRRFTAGLIARIVDAGILGEDELDALADALLGSDQVHFCLPANWFDGPVVTIPFDDEVPVGDETDAFTDADAVPEVGVPVGISRSVQPALRRWAAARLLRRDPEQLDQVRQRVRELDRRDAAAAMSGLLDALDAVRQDRGHDVISDALRWPDKTVRRLALTRLAERGDRDDAVRRALRDSDASIRAFAATLDAATPLPAVGSGSA